MTTSPEPLSERTHGQAEHAESRSARDYRAEITAYLHAHPGASTIEIARGITARDQTVRHLLDGDAAFGTTSTAPDRRAGTRCWTVRSEDL
jgi:hypothetical protein